MRRLIALKGSVCGTQSHETYELIYHENVIYAFVTKSYDNSLKIREIREDDYFHKSNNIFKEVVKDPTQFKNHQYENFVTGLWRCVILKDHEFESDKYYSHLLQLRKENKYQVSSLKSGFKLRLHQLAERLCEDDFNYGGEMQLG